MLDFIKNGKGEILNLFFKNPDGVYYLREIAKILNKEPAHYQRYLDALVEDDILQDERKGNLRLFKLNKNHPLYEELKKIISKTIGLEGQIKAIADSLVGIGAAFIFGSMAKGKENSHSDIDLMLIGSADQDKLIKAVSAAEEKLIRDINYHFFTKDEI